MTVARRVRIAGAMVAATEILLGVVLLGTVLGPYFLACACVSLAVALTLAHLLAGPPRSDDDDGSGEDHDPPPPEPPWWPEFERDLGAYLHQGRPTARNC